MTRSHPTDTQTPFSAVAGCGGNLFNGLYLHDQLRFQSAQPARQAQRTRTKMPPAALSPWCRCCVRYLPRNERKGETKQKIGPQRLCFPASVCVCVGIDLWYVPRMRFGGRGAREQSKQFARTVAVWSTARVCICVCERACGSGLQHNCCCLCHPTLW